MRRYKLTAEDVQAMIDARRNSGATTNTAAERARMKQLLDFANEKGNVGEAERLGSIRSKGQPLEFATGLNCVLENQRAFQGRWNEGGR